VCGETVLQDVNRILQKKINRLNLVFRSFANYS